MPTVALTLARFTPADRDDWLAAAAALLSAEERERVEAMPAADVRTQHAVGRALLRLAAADTAQRDPAGIAITIAEDGKPELAEMPELGVSVAHSGRMVVVAACQGAAVGVDIEAPRPDADALPEDRRAALRGERGGGAARASRRARRGLVRTRLDDQGGRRQGRRNRGDPGACGRRRRRAR